MPTPKLISFDVDGTLVDASFNDFIWLEEIPRLYAKRHKISINKAKKAVINEYEKIGEDNYLWYDLDYWIKHFELNGNFRDILKSNKNKINVFSDAVPILNDLNKRFPLIVITTMPREFLAIKIEGFKKYFKKTFSTISDFKAKKETKCYIEICNRLNIHPEELIHVGDDPKFDFEIPKKLGIKAILLNRKAGSKKKFQITNLAELRNYI